MTPLGWLGHKTSIQTNKKHWYCEDLVWDCWWLNFIDFPVLSTCDKSGFSFLDDNLSKYQGLFTKLAMCIDIMEICFGIANGQISSIFELSAHITIVAGYYRFAFLFFHKSICSGYSLEPPHWGTSNEYPQYIFHREIRDTFLLEKVPYAFRCSPVLVLPDVQCSLEEPEVRRYREGVSTTLVIC